MQRAMARLKVIFVSALPALVLLVVVKIMESSATCLLVLWVVRLLVRDGREGKCRWRVLVASASGDGFLNLGAARICCTGVAGGGGW